MRSLLRFKSESIMHGFLDDIPDFVEKIKALKDLIITNIVLVGQIPSPTFDEKRRVEFFMERLAEFRVDECTLDAYGNPIGIIRGTSKELPPVFLVAHLDTAFKEGTDFYYTVDQESITGPGLIDNSVSVGVLLSMPVFFERLGLKPASDIVLAGVIQSIGKGNLLGIRHLLKTWPTPIRGGVCLEGGELGRLNYYTEGMNRIEIFCRIAENPERKKDQFPNAIVVLNETINAILHIRLPQRPHSQIVLGKITGGHKHGESAQEARLGLEIRSDSDEMVREIRNEVRDLTASIAERYKVHLKVKTLSDVHGAGLNYNHPLVKTTVEVMKRLGLTPIRGPSESELSIFLSSNIPAVTLGLTRGENYHMENARIEIEPLFTGIAQVLGVLTAIDNGVCDGKRLA
jgi:di/tripeptidase